MKDFFLSYTSSDRGWAEWIAWELEEAGYAVTLQAWDFRPGANFVVAMDAALRENQRMIAVLSHFYARAAYTMPEWAAVLRRDPMGTAGLLVPVRVSDVPVEGLLGSIVWIDLVGRTEREAARALLAGVASGRAKPTMRPAFPGPRTVQGPPPFPAQVERVVRERREHIAAIQHDPTLCASDREYLADMFEVNALDGAHRELMNLLLAIGHEQDAIRKQRYAQDERPGWRERVAAWDARSAELDQQHNTLLEQVRAVDEQRKRITAKYPVPKGWSKLWDRLDTKNS